MSITNHGQRIEQAMAWDVADLTPRQAFELGIELGELNQWLAAQRCAANQVARGFKARYLEPALRLVAAYQYEFELWDSKLRTLAKVGLVDLAAEVLPGEMLYLRIKAVPAKPATDPTVREVVVDAYKEFTDFDLSNCTIYLTTAQWEQMVVEEDWTPEYAESVRQRGKLLGASVVYDAPEFKVE